MRLLDEFARFWNDARLRMPQAAWSHTIWIWPLAAAGAGALVVLVGARPPDMPAAADANVTTGANASVDATPKTVSTTATAPGACRDQTWPYFTDDCLWRNIGSTRHREAKHVPVLPYEPAMAAAAIGATPWSPKGKTKGPKGKAPASWQTTGRQKQATREPMGSVTIIQSGRRGRNGARPRTFPPDAFEAYGSARR